MPLIQSSHLQFYNLHSGPFTGSFPSLLASITPLFLTIVNGLDCQDHRSPKQDDSSRNQLEIEISLKTIPKMTSSWGGIDVTEDDATATDMLEDVIVTEEDLLTWSISCLMKAGADETPARQMSNILLSADRRGHYSHGFNRPEVYFNDISRYCITRTMGPTLAQSIAFSE